MPEVTTVEKGGRIRHVIKAQPGDHFEICRCYGSKEFPFCDGTHKTMHSCVAPAIVEVALPDQDEDNQA